MSDPQVRALVNPRRNDPSPSDEAPPLRLTALEPAQAPAGGTTTRGLDELRTRAGNPAVAGPVRLAPPFSAEPLHLWSPKFAPEWTLVTTAY
jgi:hypothetical protein